MIWRQRHQAMTHPYGLLRLRQPSLSFLASRLTPKPRASNTIRYPTAVKLLQPLICPSTHSAAPSTASMTANDPNSCACGSRVVEGRGDSIVVVEGEASTLTGTGCGLSSADDKFTAGARVPFVCVGSKNEKKLCDNECLCCCKPTPIYNVRDVLVVYYGYLAIPSLGRPSQLHLRMHCCLLLGSRSRLHRLRVIEAVMGRLVEESRWIDCARGRAGGHFQSFRVMERVMGACRRKVPLNCCDASCLVVGCVGTVMGCRSVCPWVPRMVNLAYLVARMVGRT